MLFGIKDFSLFLEKNDTEEVRFIFNPILKYIYETKVNIEAEHTMQIDNSIFLRFKDSNQGRFYNILVIEKISSPLTEKILSPIWGRISRRKPFCIVCVQIGRCL